ncbi:hypothetical protein [Pontibacillus yanchengensis]|uniref:Uncharacterized protein n=1 Tax=Pontibacillus yanchengensis Y32 TaxID=1385514 RepID=A0A0A2T7P2_9BACI|nr:hypothetical protein [Pontibacillus yanchengensis]KGP71812.1 hypothetical protein N782_16320 [Pontibacillus yanchengensis Y32]
MKAKGKWMLLGLLLINLITWPTIGYILIKNNENLLSESSNTSSQADSTSGGSVDMYAPGELEIVFAMIGIILAVFILFWLFFRKK